MQKSDPNFILLNTSHPGNIGAAARAMKNMGLGRLSLVAPLIFPSAEATARASGADDLLADASVYPVLAEAIADATLVVGASARTRTLPVPILNPRACAQLIFEQPDVRRVAVLFGNEQSGLSNQELDQCHYLVQIPTNPDYSSLNLAAAVQVIAYELRVAALEMKGLDNAVETPDYATVEQVEQFYRHLEQTLVEIDFLNPANPKHLMRRLRRLFGRVRLDDNEVNILRGILTAINKAKNN
jgi:tRNA (cytidine32/uridine32-2'-O)-methyltransferase